MSIGAVTTCGGGACIGARAQFDVLGTTAHELRLPLSHIKGFVTSLQRTDVEWDEDTRRDFLAQIDRETDRLNELLEELLDGTPGASVRQPVERAPAALVNGGLDRLGGLLGARPVQLQIPASLPDVRVDVAAIERVLANLIQNALKYAPPDCPIRITMRAVDNELEVRVEDEGPGIPADQRERIFHRFMRLPLAERDGHPGQGLGLAICRTIVNAHGGRIWADERPGGGARFTFTLPLAPTRRQRGVQPAVLAPRPQLSSPRPARGRPRRGL